MNRSQRLKVGDMIEHQNGLVGLVTDVEMMYPGNPYSPIGRIEVDWLGDSPGWWRRGLKFDVISINRVVSRGVGKGSQG